MPLLCVTHLAPVGIIVTGEIVALIPCSVSVISNVVLIGVPVVFTVKKYKPFCGFSVDSNPFGCYIVGCSLSAISNPCSARSCC